MSEHQHEEWQLHTGRDGGVYCAACGTRTSPTPDDAARPEAPTEAEQWRLADILKSLIEDVRDEPQFTDADHALMGAEEISREWLPHHDAEVRADERARIAARRDDVSDAVQRARAETYPDEPTSTAIVDAVLATLGVSDR